MDYYGQGSGAYGSYKKSDIDPADFARLSDNYQRNLADPNAGVYGSAIMSDLAGYDARQKAKAAQSTQNVVPRNNAGESLADQQAKGATTPAAQKPAAGGAAPMSSAPAQQAMQGLQSVVMQDQQGPTPGWADDPALAQTAGELGSQVPSQAVGALSAMVRRGIY